MAQVASLTSYTTVQADADPNHNGVFVADEFDFNGSSQMRIPSAALLFGTDPLSVEMWVEPRELSGFRTLLHRRDASGSKELELRIGRESGDREIFFLTNGGAGGPGSTKAFTAGMVWTGGFVHIAAVRANDRQSLYVDNVRYDAGDFSSPHDVGSTNDIFLGTFANAPIPGTNFEGRLKKIRLYDHALSDSEVADFYAEGP